MISKPLVEVATVIAGQSPASSTYNSDGDGLPFFQGKADFQEMYPKERMWCTSERRKEAEPGDVLISVRAPVGAVNICNQKSVIGRGLSAIRPSSDLNEMFLYYFLKANEQKISALGTGSTFKAITQDTLKRIEIPLPPLDDQKRIAHLLGKIEGLIAQRKQHLQQLDDLLKSTFLEMFGPMAPGFDDWPLVEIKDLAAKHKRAMRTGPFGSNLLHSEFTAEGDVAVLGIDNAVQNCFAWGERRFISDEKYQELENYKIYPGDVIVTIMGTIGRSAVIPDDVPLAINTKHLVAITLNREIANPFFLSYSIHSSPFILKQFQSKTRGAIMSGLNLGLIKETKLKRPPIEMQNRFTAIHKKIDGIKSCYQQSLTDLENLYGALSQKAFKGELDLSRIPLLVNVESSIELQEEFVIEKITTDGSLFFNLPNSKDYPLSDLENRREIIRRAFSRLVHNSSAGEEISLTRFWDKLYWESGDHAGEGDLPFHVKDYDYLKQLLFEAIRGGKIEQTRDRLELGGDEELGNKIVLKRALQD